LGLPLEDTFTSLEVIQAHNYKLSIDGKDIYFNPAKDIIWDKTTQTTSHPNSIIAILPNGEEKLFESVGGGVVNPDPFPKAYNNCPKELSFHNLGSFIDAAVNFKGSIYDFIMAREMAITEKTEAKILDELRLKFSYMMAGVENGKSKTGSLLGLTTYRSKSLFEHFLAHPNRYDYKMITYAAAIAFAEHNATGGIVISAPTAGGGGVLPGVLYGLQHLGIAKEELIKSMLIAGIIGLVIEHNACISGAEAGCTFEIGAAAAMAAGLAVYTQLKDSSNEENKRMILDKISQAAEMIFEHNWNMACDCVDGFVVIPCVERNGDKAYSAVGTADIVLVPNPNYSPKVGFDALVKIAFEHGKKLPFGLRETGIDGVTKALRRNLSNP
jgi:L-serine dehydratase